MKKYISTLTLALLSLAASAQEYYGEESAPEQKHSVATNSFWSNWYVQLGGDWNVWYSDQEHHNDAHKGMGLLGSDRRTFGGSVALGKWFTPGIGLRTKFQIGKGKSIPALSAETSKFNQWTLSEQVTLNLSNLLYGYSESRVWNLIPFAGAGVARNMSGQSNVFSLSAGLQSSWKITRGLRIYLEAGINSYEGEFDATESYLAHDGFWTKHDNGVYGEVGLTLNIGRSGWKKTPDADAIQAMSQAELEALNAQLADMQAENEHLRTMLEDGKPPVEDEAPSVEEKILASDVSVFFPLGSASIASASDLVDVESLVKLALEEDLKIRVTGYADSDTGSADINRRLSEQRANAVASEIEKMGASSDQIIIEAKGGVADLTPVNYNRRVVVSVTR